MGTDRNGLYGNREGAEMNTPYGGDGSSSPPSLCQSEKKKQKQAYGQEANVFLTDEEYKHLTESLGIPKAYIDRFSQKLAQTPYGYTNHAVAIEDWWAKDKNSPQWSLSPQGSQTGGNGPRSLPASQPTDYQSSFDGDEFFYRAVARSLGEECAQAMRRNS